ncbi:DUF7547 family protein [Halobaculum lipolyticum]|uniref:Uncharacterized protein n=1 Tax=Halobaculum lipolyticum TaxID=3032001 RepID=A0ABD5W9R2_9EURY|nr:hypothetical protein [Halobaculum sp. DT31]
MSAPSRDPRDDEDLAALVDELETTLTDLRAELADRRGGPPARRSRDDRDADRRDDWGADRWDRQRRGPPRPPRVGELFRFTSDYTIPTVVAVLEATIEALELLQGVIDLASPGETPDRRRRGGGGRDRRGLGRSMLSDALADGVSSATDRATTDAADALSRLRETLSEADLPQDEESRDLVADARELSAELERRVRESSEAVDRERRRERREGRDEPSSADDAGGPVSIAVGGPDEPTDEPGGGRDETHGASDGAGDDDTDAEDSAPEVDVDAELASIKRQMGKSDGDADEAAADAAVDDEDADTDGSDAAEADDADDTDDTGDTDVTDGER